MKQQVNDIQTEKLYEIFGKMPITPTSDFFCASIQYSSSFGLFKEPCKYSGYGIVYCKSGAFMVNMNLREYKIEKGVMLVYTPGTIISASLCEDCPVEDIQAVIVAGSHSLVSDIQIDLTRVYDETMTILGKPCITLTNEEKTLGDKYFELMIEIENSKLHNYKDSLKLVFKSMFSTMLGLMSKNVNQTEIPREVNTRSRRVFENFLKLVTQYHQSERYLEFYAEKLCLTPKYLSATVKMVSGRSAPEWIDSFVIVEAKNLLKYSNLDVKEIGFKLNFNAPSVFCRFFKAQTGMTPTEYRNK